MTTNRMESVSYTELMQVEGGGRFRRRLKRAIKKAARRVGKNVFGGAGAPGEVVIKTPPIPY